MNFKPSLVSKAALYKTAALVAALAISGCAGAGALNVSPAVAPVPPGLESLSFAAPGLPAQSSMRAEYKDNDQEEEYVLYRGDNGAQAEAISVVASFYGAGAAGGDKHALDFAKTAKGTVGMWNMAKTGGVTYSGDSFAYKGKLPYYIQPFQRTDTGQSCFGFHSEFNRDAHDPQNGYDNHLFGYYCAPKGKSLTKDEMGTTVDGLDIAGLTKRAPAALMERTFQQLKNDEALKMAVKRGDPAGQTGIEAFPLYLVRIYSDNLGGADGRP